MAVNIYLPHFRQKSQNKIFVMKKSKLFDAEDYEKEEILFLSFTCEDIGVAMVTNMISQ